ncbi:MAG TPA: fibronectin type III domain-containing protein [Vicinamibacterales bacterium]|nr:fibronectin type III domain-containing protein [Vicinamibacterales bacterium]
MSRLLLFVSALFLAFGSPTGAVPSAPGSLVATVTGSTVALTWLAPAGLITGYRLEAGTSTGATNAANAIVGTATAYTAVNVPAGTYYVRVRAVAPDGESATTNEVVIFVGGGAGCTSAPNPPRNLVVIVAGALVNMTWSAPAGGCPATAYVLRAGSAPALSDIASIPVGGVLGLSATAPNGTYYIHVVAQNAFGTSAPSNVGTAVVGSSPIPPAPTPPAPTPPGPTPPPPPPPTPSFGPGQWLVNRQIAPGRYYSDPASGCYWERQRGLSGSFSDIISNEFIGFDALQWIVDIASTDVAFETDAACGQWSQSPRPAPTGIPGGVWRVGQQIPPGTYQVAAKSGCYWERLRGFSGTFNDIIANKFVSTASPQLVTIMSTDVGFNNDDCGTWTRISSDEADQQGTPSRADIESEWRLHYEFRSSREPRPLVKQ